MRGFLDALLPARVREMTGISIANAIRAYFDAHSEGRGDEDVAHVSDLFGCDLATWARRDGRPMLSISHEMRMKWKIGHAVEATVAEAVADVLALDGWTIERNTVVEVFGLKGHLDIALRRDDEAILVEVKSTSFLRGKPPTEPSEHYRIQAASYALAIGAQRVGVFIVCRESGKWAEFWFDAEPMRQYLENRAAEVIGLTDPAKEPPVASPRFGWQCRYCNYAECLQNANPARARA